MIKMNFKVFFVVLFVFMGINSLYAQSIEQSVSDHERSYRELITAMNRISRSSGYNSSDWNSLQRAIDFNRQTSHRIEYLQTNNWREMEQYERRISNASNGFRQAWNDLRNWVNQNADSIPRDPVRIAESIAEWL